MARRLGLRAFLAQFVGIAPQPGRAYLVMGPHCWGRGASVAEAHKKAQSNRVRIYEGAKGWRFILYNVPEGAEIDGMGSIVYDAGQQGAIEMARFNMQDDKGEQ